MGRLNAISKRNSRLKEYPCDVYLHNALAFITEGKSNVAYSEICWAICKSGGELSEAEKQHWKEVQNG